MVLPCSLYIYLTKAWLDLAGLEQPVYLVRFLSISIADGVRIFFVTRG